MIGIISRGGSNLYGALMYNAEKVNAGQADLLFGNRVAMPSDPSAPFDMHRAMRSFEPYMNSGHNLTKTVFHASLNPDSKDEADGRTADRFRAGIHAAHGLRRSALLRVPTPGHRPRTRPYRFGADARGRDEDRRLQGSPKPVCPDSQRHGTYIRPAPVRQAGRAGFGTNQKVEYGHENLKQQISSVVRLLTQQYKFGSFPELNALLNLYNVGLEERKGEHLGQRYHGLVYSALNDKGEPVGVPIKSSRIGKDVGFERLEKKRLSDLEKYIGSAELKSRTRDEVIRAMHESRTKGEFAEHLKRRGINALFRENARSGRIYGVTFIDHNTKMVLNGSRLGKNYSANVFQELFNNPRADRAALLPKLPQVRNAQTPKTVQSPEQKRKPQNRPGITRRSAARKNAGTAADHPAGGVPPAAWRTRRSGQPPRTILYRRFWGRWIWWPLDWKTNRCRPTNSTRYAKIWPASTGAGKRKDIPCTNKKAGRIAPSGLGRRRFH